MKSPIRRLSPKKLLTSLEQSPFYLNQVNAKADLTRIYEGFFHKDLNATIIKNFGAKLLVSSPLSGIKSIIEHIGFYISIANYGCEILNVAVYGNLFKAPKIIVRSESACPPSILFGSQRCNCWDQLATARELAGFYHDIKLPHFNSFKKLEEFVKAYKPDYTVPAVILIYLDSQCGMGSGVVPNLYNGSITDTAFIRHRGEYTTEQIYDVSMAASFKLLGIDPDSRSYYGGLGYKMPGAALDCFRINKDIILLTNNPLKEKALLSMGYLVDRRSIHGRCDIACQGETQDRKNQFGHLIEWRKDTNPVSEAKRLIREIEQRRLK